MRGKKGGERLGLAGHTCVPLVELMGLCTPTHTPCPLGDSGPGGRRGVCFLVTAVFPALEERGMQTQRKKRTVGSSQPGCPGEAAPPHSECFPAFKRVVCGECGTAVAVRPSLSSTWRLFAMTGLRRKAYNSSVLLLMTTPHTTEPARGASF